MRPALRNKEFRRKLAVSAAFLAVCRLADLIETPGWALGLTAQEKVSVERFHKAGRRAIRLMDPTPKGWL